MRARLESGNGRANAPLDFNAAESFTPGSGDLDVRNTNNQTSASPSMFFTRGRHDAGAVAADPGIDHTDHDSDGVRYPGGADGSGDLHEVIATVQTTGRCDRATRQIITFARTLATRSLAFGPAMPAPTVSAVARRSGRRRGFARRGRCLTNTTPACRST